MFNRPAGERMVLSGARILLTGASSGIGRELALALAATREEWERERAD